MKRRLSWLLSLALLVPSCDQHSGGQIIAPPPVPGPSPAPDRVEAAFPPPRSVRVPYDSPVWVQFKVPVDTTTINDRTVFFKIDTQRLSAARVWDAGTRSLRIVPTNGLQLRKTYTVELSASIRFVDGTTLGKPYSWQFTTNSLRRPESPSPQDGSTDESPFVALRWAGFTEASAGPVTYEVHAGASPAAALDPSRPGQVALVRTSKALFIPRDRWGQDGPTYWAVHALNGATGERLVGPAWRFTTFPANAAYDSVAVAVLDWNWVESNNALRQRCTEDSLVMGVKANIISTIRWDLGVPDTTVRLTGAAIELTPRYATVPAVVGPSIWYATGLFLGCSHGPPATGPPVTEETDAMGKLADAVVLRPDRIRFSSDALTAHLEATRRLGGLYGYLYRADRRRSYYGPGAGSPTVRATMWLYIYRPPPAPALAGSRHDR